VERAGRQRDRAEDADPLAPIILFHRAGFIGITGMAVEARAAWERAAELGGGLDCIDFYRVVFYATRSKMAEAPEIARRLDPLHTPWNGEATSAMLHAILGEREAAYRDLEALVAAAKDHSAPAYGIAWTYGVLGDADRFFEWLFRSAGERGRFPFEFVTLPLFETLRGDPRFQTYLKRCGLSE